MPVLESTFARLDEIWQDNQSNEAALDISAFTTRRYVFKDPSGNLTTKTVAFKASGTNGILTYTIEADLLDEAGDWAVQVVLWNATERVYCTPVNLTVSAILS